MCSILILVLYPFFVLWHLDLPPVERALILGAFTSGLPVAVVSILHALYGLKHDASGWSATAQFEVIVVFSLVLSNTIISDNPSQASSSLIVCNLVIIITHLYQVIRRIRIQVNCRVFCLWLAKRRAMNVEHSRSGSSYRVSTSQPRIFSRKTPTRLDVNLTELSSKFGLRSSLFTRSSSSSGKETVEDGRRRWHPRLGPLNTTNSVDSLGSPLEFARHHVFRQSWCSSPSASLPEPELAHLQPELGERWPGHP
jgi:hypothetical protein